MDVYSIIDVLLKYDLNELMESIMEYVDSMDSSY